MLLALDYAKAFNTLKWELIFEALQFFGFGDFNIKAVKTMFTYIKTCVVNSGFFYPERGVRQGCCSSPSLFVLAVELLAILVRNSLEIKGLSINGFNIKLSQYAVMRLFLKDFRLMSHLLQLIKEFATFSGLSNQCPQVLSAPFGQPSRSTSFLGRNQGYGPRQNPGYHFHQRHVTRGSISI